MSKNNLVRKCFYIQTDGIDNQATILYILTFNQYLKCTDAYSVNYSAISANQPPEPVSGTSNQTGENRFQCYFNDNARMTIQFTDSNLESGSVDLITPNLAGNFSIVQTTAYEK